MRFRVHEQSHRVSNVLRSKERAIRKINAFAQVEGDGAPIAGNRPRGCESGFQGLGLPVEPDKYAAGQVTNVLRGFIVNQDWIESLGFPVEAEVEFAAGLRSNGERECQQTN